jgi:hypothetical protein
MKAMPSVAVLGLVPVPTSQTGRGAAELRPTSSPQSPSNAGGERMATKDELACIDQELARKKRASPSRFLIAIPNLLAKFHVF